MSSFIPLLLAGALLSPVALADTQSTPSESSDFPVTVKDDRNKTVMFDRKPESVASVSVFGADLLWALDQQATGISTLNHRASAYLGEQVESMTDLGEIHETNLEQLTTLNPDLIIGLRQYTEPFAEKFEEIGQFLAFDLVTSEDSDQAIVTVATAMGQQNRGKQLNQRFEALKQAYQQKTQGQPAQKAVLIWQWADTLYGFYDHYLTTDLMAALNIRNAMGRSPTPALKKPDSSVLTMEKLLRMNPDIILTFTGHDNPVSQHPVWRQLKAVRQQRIYRVNDQYVMPHGPNARQMVLKEMAHLFYPALFPVPEGIPDKARAKAMTFVDQ